MMTPLLFDLLILAGGASKIVFALVFLHWIDTRRAHPQAQAVGYRVKTGDRSRRGL